MVAWTYGIFLLMLKIIPLVSYAHSWNIHPSKRDFVSPRGHVHNNEYDLKKQNHQNIFSLLEN